MPKATRTRYSTVLPEGPVSITFPGVRTLDLTVEDGTVLLDDADHRALTLAGHRLPLPADAGSTPATGDDGTPDSPASRQG